MCVCVCVCVCAQAGKSTYLKQVGLLVIMAQAGSFVPADSMVLTPRRQVCVCVCVCVTFAVPIMANSVCVCAIQALRLSCKPGAHGCACALCHTHTFAAVHAYGSRGQHRDKLIQLYGGDAGWNAHTHTHTHTAPPSQVHGMCAGMSGLSPSSMCVYVRLHVRVCVCACVCVCICVQEMGLILDYADPHSLVLVDELGRGTSTLDGVALCWAAAEALVAARALTLLATHFPQLTDLPQVYPQARVYTLQVRVRAYVGAAVCVCVCVCVCARIYSPRCTNLLGAAQRWQHT